jgi:iron complex outermembrane recepter protein
VPYTPTLGAAIVLLATSTVAAQSLEETRVVAHHDTRVVEIDSTLVIAADAAALLKRAPGANVNSNGPLTGIPQYRGMFGQRVATSIDGMQLAPSGPNWMDPPLSYVTSSQLQSLQLYRGIAPVSVAQESLGGAVAAYSSRGEFLQSPDWQGSGRVLAGGQSVNGGSQLSLSMVAANANNRLKFSATDESANDAESARGDITPTEYQRRRYDIGYGYQSGRHTLQIDYANNDTDAAGTPALPMDIQYFEGDVYGLNYTFDADDDLQVSARVYGSELQHGMSNYHLRTAPMDAMQRRNIASSDNLGFDLKSNWRDASGLWMAGVDGFQSDHQSDIDNPKNPMFYVDNFNDVQRKVLGVFVERQQDFGAGFSGEFGVRFNRVSMEAGEVNGTPAMMMPAAAALRDAFNSADRRQRDDNLDVVARLWVPLAKNTRLYAGVAQKHRSPSYQERYLWLPMQATAGLADGNTYTGNIELNPEVARQLEFGFDLTGAALSLSPRVFYSDVKDYIQGVPSELMPAQMTVMMMNNMNGTANPAPLQFENVDAHLYGFDMDWSLALDQHWSLSGIVNYVRGERDDIDDALYRIAPANITTRAQYSQANWRVELESVLYASQDNVSKTNSEQASSGYGLLNISALWQVSPQLRLALGIDNVLDKYYQSHLSGINRTNSDGGRVPGYGQNLYGQLIYEF